MNRTTLIQQFEAFVSQYDLSDSRVLLKKEHSYRVAENCERLAKELNLDVEFAYAMGILHDIGRFEQLKRYHTFHDAKSCNHAFLSADLLKEFGIHDSKLDFCIRWHSAYQLPECEESLRQMAELLRDADKIDIIRVNVCSSFEDIYGLPEKELYQTSISPAVWQDLCAHQTVYQAHRKTAIDFRLSHVAFVYGLYYPQSKQLLDEQGSIWQMIDFTSQIPSVNQQLDQLRKEIERTIHNTN